MDEFLKQLAGRLQVPDSEIVTADETRDWLQGRLDELLSQKILTEIGHGREVVCDECEENCSIEPNIRTIPGTDERVGAFVCTRNPDIGRIEVDLDRLRQWRINKKKLWKLVYGFESEWQVPWDDDNSEYIPLQEAVNLANDDSITVRKMSRLLEDPDFPVHRMQKGRRCNVHLGGFKQWLKYAKHGVITDKAIDKYLEQTKEREKEAKVKKRKTRQSR